MTKIVEKIVKITVNVLTGIVLMAILVLLYGKIEMQISGKNYSNYFGYTLFKVTTGSMGNAIKIDDVIIVKIGDTYNVNDIITYYEDKSFITHRVVKIDNNFLTTKGDANNSDDTPIAKTQVIGRVVHIISGLGIWQKVFSTPQIIISILVTLLLFDFSFSLKNKRELEKTKKLDLDKIKDMSNTQIFKLDELIEETKKQRNLKQKEKINEFDTIEEVEQVSQTLEKDFDKVDENLFKIELKEKVENIDGIKNIDTEIEVLESLISDNKDIEIDHLTEEEEIELLATQIIPIEEIRKQEIL